jgi:hypothetical protein
VIQEENEGFPTRKNAVFAIQKEEAFFQLAERFRLADDPEQVKQLGNQLGRFVFRE